MSTGLIVTRSASDSDLGTATGTQLSQSSTAMLIAGCASIGLALLPGMPKLPFLGVGIVLVVASRRVRARDVAREAAAETEEATPHEPQRDATEQILEVQRRTLRRSAGPAGLNSVPPLCPVAGVAPVPDAASWLRRFSRAWSFSPSPASAVVILRFGIFFFAASIPAYEASLKEWSPRPPTSKAMAALNSEPEEPLPEPPADLSFEPQAARPAVMATAAAMETTRFTGHSLG